MSSLAVIYYTYIHFSSIHPNSRVIFQLRFSLLTCRDIVVNVVIVTFNISRTHNATNKYLDGSTEYALLFELHLLLGTLPSPKKKKKKKEQEQ